MNDIHEEIKLIEPTVELKDEFLNKAKEYVLVGEDYYNASLAQKDFKAYIQKLVEESQEINLSPGIVPMTTYWLVKNNAIILGESRLRHSLTPALEHHGGHIGYVIQPSQRRKGYGTLILSLTLEKAQSLGISRIRITCDTDNIGSARVIEKNGGILSNQVISERSGRLISQYWINL